MSFFCRLLFFYPRLAVLSSQFCSDAPLLVLQKRKKENQFLTYGGNGVRHMGKRGKKHPSTNSDLSPIARTFGASSGGVFYRLRHEPLPELKSARISPPSPRRASRERDPWPTPAFVDGGVGGRPTCLLAHAKLNQLEIPIRDPNERPQLEIPIRDPN